MKFLKTLLLTGIIFSGVLSFAGQQSIPKMITDIFFDKIKEGKISEAYEKLFKGSQIPTAKPEALAVIKRQTNAGIALYGKVLGYELIEEKKLGSSIVKLVYVLNLDVHPLAWEFFFYKAKSRWVLSQVKFDDNFTILNNIE